MSDEILKFPAGSAINFSAGEYSDFRYCGSIVTIKDCDLLALGEEYKKQYVPEYEGEKAHPDGFPTWLIVNGHAFPAKIQDVHVGSSDFEIDPDFEQ